MRESGAACVECSAMRLECGEVYRALGRYGVAAVAWPVVSDEGGRLRIADMQATVLAPVMSLQSDQRSRGARAWWYTRSTRSTAGPRS